ncbi:MAG: hypothetical protein J6X71_09575 [Bacteroidales bacterium]|nr:hypothetical protein [Bacteroidales bacterium]
MKHLHIFSALAALLLGTAALAQTPEEIITNMDREMSKYDEADGVVMTVDIKIPIMGTMSTKTWSLGNKNRVEANAMGATIITWDDGTTTWTYDGKKNEITIEKSKINKDGSKESSDGDLSMFDGITDGYDLSITKETAKAWYIRCKKSKSNKDKDAPKKMDLVVAKGSYYPLSLSASAGGLDMTMKDISFGVKEEEVTFNQADFPTAAIVDKR